MTIISFVVVVAVLIGAVFCALTLRDSWREEAREHDRKMQELLDDPDFEFPSWVTPDMF